MRVLRATARDSVSIPQRSDENQDIDDFEGWVMRDDGKPLYIIGTEGVTMESSKRRKSDTSMWIDNSVWIDN